MKLRKLEINNFRAFERVAVDFPESGILLIAGANNSGKTALLSAIDMIAFGGAIPSMRHLGTSEAASITASFSPSDNGARGTTQQIGGSWPTRLRGIP